MKNCKRFFAATLIILILVASAWAANLPRDDGPGFPAIQVMPVSPGCFTDITGPGDVSVTDCKTIMFGSDLDIKINSESVTWPYVAGTPIGISLGVTTIHVSAACKAWKF